MTLEWLLHESVERVIQGPQQQSHQSCWRNSETAQNRVEVINIAVVDGNDESSQFYIDNSSDNISSVLPLESADPYTLCRVVARRISSIVRDRGGAADHVKIDKELTRRFCGNVFRRRSAKTCFRRGSLNRVLFRFVAAGYKKFQIVEEHLPARSAIAATIGVNGSSRRDGKAAGKAQGRRVARNTFSDDHDL